MIPAIYSSVIGRAFVKAEGVVKVGSAVLCCDVPVDKAVDGGGGAP